MSDAHDWRLPPERPSITPAFALGVVIWASCAAAFSAFRTVDEVRLAEVSTTVLAVAVLVSAALAFRRFRRIGMLCVIAALLGVSLAGFGANDLKVSAGLMSDKSVVDTVAVVEEDSRASAYGERATATVFVDGKRFRTALRFNSDDVYFQGDRLEIKAKVKPIDYGSSEFDWTQGNAATLDVFSTVKLDERSPLCAIFTS